jgi:methylmalonyl-CoA mutase cobalamin-binding subunit
VKKSENKRGTIVAGALGECVHVAGVLNFLQLAEQVGYQTIFLGPAVPIGEFIEAINRERADLVGVSYRLTPDTGVQLLGDFAEAADELRELGVRFVFGGTPPLAERAETLGFFEEVFDGGRPVDAVLAYLKGDGWAENEETQFPQNAIERIESKAPIPLLRHHFGLPTLEDTRKGIEEIADAKILDVISLGIDQDAQENFFRPERQKPKAIGAGGVPVRSADDYALLYAASRRGNYPLMRTYSGTNDFLRLAEMYVDTIHIAWCAIPIFWFNKMDGRGPLGLEESIREHQRVIAWYSTRGIPVELNEPHHWGMRGASDVIFVVSAFLSAYNARAFGVEDYIMQMMFNSPPQISDAMDLAKMLACVKVVESLESPMFRVWRQTRTGLLSYPQDLIEARAHLASSVYFQMALQPHVIHVVGHTEAHHAATGEDVIEACLLARRSIVNALRGAPNMTENIEIQARVLELIEQAEVTLEAIRALAQPGDPDPLTNPSVLARAVTTGILDAPQLKNNPYALGMDSTSADKRGAIVSVHHETRNQISEKERISQLRQ